MSSIISNYIHSTGCPERYLRNIAEAGFTCVDWGHHWGDDSFYSTSETRQIQKWLNEFSLKVNAVHGLAGLEKCWSSCVEYERLAGVELLRNRIQFTAELSCDVMVMHLFGAPDEIRWEGKDRSMDSLFKSLDELEPVARSHGVVIAVENGYFEFLAPVLTRYSPDYVGLCYDSGHGNFHGGRGLISLERFKNRLRALHVHDNDETDDSHSLPFTGTVDWKRLTRIVGESSLDRCPTVEANMAGAGIDDERQFLEKALEVGNIVGRMIREH